MTKPDIKIRYGQPEDAEAIASILIASRKAALPFAPIPYSDAEVLHWVQKVLLLDFRVWLACERESGRAVGMAAMVDGFVDQLYLHPAWYRQGVGTLLMERMKAESQGYLELYCFQRNKDARAFYEDQGFTLAAERDGSANVEGQPDCLYRWEAAPGLRWP